MRQKVEKYKRTAASPPARKAGSALPPKGNFKARQRGFSESSLWRRANATTLLVFLFNDVLACPFHQRAQGLDVIFVDFILEQSLDEIVDRRIELIVRDFHALVHFFHALAGVL